MAGIGFELKKLFRATGVIGTLKAYGYTGIITAGPMLLGIFYLMGISLIGARFGMSENNRQLLTCMITYSLLFSLLVTGTISMAVTRYVADMLYSEKEKDVISSLVGVLTITLPLGDIIYAMFLLFAGIRFEYVVLNLLLVSELMTTWILMNYMSAIKNYKGILIGYVFAVLVSLVGSYIGCIVFEATIGVLLIFVCLGYGIMMCIDFVLLYGYFPESGNNYFDFLHWFDEYKSLMVIGLFTSVGLYSHLVIAWMSDIGIQVQGVYYGAPEHDVAALFAFLTMIVTNINFVASVEVHFYPKYRHYYDLFNGKGYVNEIQQAEREMKEVMWHEIAYTAKRQFYTTAIMLSVGLMFLNRMPLGFNDLMDGYFRILCVGYGVYAIGNVIMLILMYFTDYTGAAVGTVIFAAVTIAGCVYSLFLPSKFYGFAFCIGAIVYFVYNLIRLIVYLGNLPYHILASQPIIYRDKNGLFTMLGNIFNRMFSKC